MRSLFSLDRIFRDCFMARPSLRITRSAVVPGLSRCGLVEKGQKLYPSNHLSMQRVIAKVSTEQDA